MVNIMICSNCNHKQPGGKFCELCGGQLVIEPEPTPIQSTNSQPIQHEGDRVHVETTESQPQLTQSYQQVSTNNPTKQGTTLQEYKTSFTQLIKNPTNAFT